MGGYELKALFMGAWSYVIKEYIYMGSYKQNPIIADTFS